MSRYDFDKPRNTSLDGIAQELPRCLICGQYIGRAEPAYRVLEDAGCLVGWEHQDCHEAGQ